MRGRKSTQPFARYLVSVARSCLYDFAWLKHGAALREQVHGMEHRRAKCAGCRLAQHHNSKTWMVAIAKATSDQLSPQFTMDRDCCRVVVALLATMLIARKK